MPSEEAIRENQIPGVVAHRPLHRDDIFRIASQSKAVTATAVMMLWEEGRFRLDD